MIEVSSSLEKTSSPPQRLPPLLHSIDLIECYRLLLPPRLHLLDPLRSLNTPRRARRHFSSSQQHPYSDPQFLSILAGPKTGIPSASTETIMADPLGTGSVSHLSICQSSVQTHSATCSSSVLSLSVPRTSLAGTISRSAQIDARMRSCSVHCLL